MSGQRGVEGAGPGRCGKGWPYQRYPRGPQEDDLGAQLEFALKREGVDLSVLATLFSSIDPEEVEEVVSRTPTGKYSRRIWFLYEWLTGRTLNLPDAPKFGFVYIHPFEDGNGRIHRWLIHHVLARADYSPHGLVFPVSAAILRHVSEYGEVLRSYSVPLLEYIDWEATEKGNVRVVNQTDRLYRYFDATAHAEFLFERVEETVERDLPREIAYLEGFDRFAEGVQRLLGDMPHSTVDLLHGFLAQGRGRLSKGACEKEFPMLTPEEAAAVEDLWLECHPEVDP